MDFQIIVEVKSCICVNHFLNVKICQTAQNIEHFPSSNAERFLCIPYKLCWRVLRNWLYAGRPIVRTEEIVTRISCDGRFPILDNL
jgi:hypothetical protein